ncbi:hypothetical protein MTO96_038806 [Rhipicephalus appendiculatus]
MKDSKLGDGSNRRRTAGGSTEKKGKAKGRAPTVNAASVAFGSGAATQSGNQAAQNGISGLYRDAVSVPPIMPQFATPQTTQQPISNQPGTSSMAAVLLALRMVGLSPQPNSQPVIWIPLDVPQPRTTQVGCNGAQTTEQRDLVQEAPRLEDPQAQAVVAGRGISGRKGKRSRCRVHGISPTTSGDKTKPKQATAQQKCLARGASGSPAANDGTKKLSVAQRREGALPAYGANVNVGSVALPGIVATVIPAGLGALPLLPAAADGPRDPMGPKDKANSKLGPGDKHEEGGKSADRGESAVTTGRKGENMVAIYIALGLLLASLVAAFSFFLVLGTPHNAFYERLVASP